MTPLDPRDKITICLASYIALRAQLAERNAMLYQVFAIAALLLLPIGALVLTRSIPIGAALGVALALILLVTLRFNKSDRVGTAQRLEQLRLQINRLANDELLKPETAGIESLMDHLPSLQDAAQSLEDLGLRFRRLWQPRAGA